MQKTVLSDLDLCISRALLSSAQEQKHQHRHKTLVLDGSSP